MHNLVVYIFPPFTVWKSACVKRLLGGGGCWDQEGRSPDLFAPCWEAPGSLAFPAATTFHLWSGLTVRKDTSLFWGPRKNKWRKVWLQSQTCKGLSSRAGSCFWSLLSGLLLCFLQGCLSSATALRGIFASWPPRRDWMPSALTSSNF